MKFAAICLGMALVSLTLSIGTIAYMCACGGCYGIKNISFGDASVSVLGVIVGLLVGWQIYKTIDMDKKIENVKSIARKEAESIIDDHVHIFNAKMILSYTLNRYTTADVDRFVDGCIKSLDESIKGSDYFFIDNILTLLNRLKEEQVNQIYPHKILMQGRKLYYLSVLYSVANKNDEWKEIANYISTFKEESFAENFIPDYVLDYYGKQ